MQYVYFLQSNLICFLLQVMVSLLAREVHEVWKIQVFISLCLPYAFLLADLVILVRTEPASAKSCRCPMSLTGFKCARWQRLTTLKGPKDTLKNGLYKRSEYLQLSIRQQTS
jgi:hypothetical protein